MLAQIVGANVCKLFHFEYTKKMLPNCDSFWFALELLLTFDAIKVDSVFSGLTSPLSFSSEACSRDVIVMSCKKKRFHVFLFHQGTLLGSDHLLIVYNRIFVKLYATFLKKINYFCMIIENLVHNYTDRQTVRQTGKKVIL